MKTKTCYETHENCNGSSCNHEKATFTPGPWNVQDLGANKDGYPYWHEYCVRAPNNVHLATVGSVDRFYESSNAANARLIAAAPELLNALVLSEKILFAALALHATENKTGIMLDKLTVAHIAARAAIAKATT